MKISFLYNWPIGRGNLVRVSFGVSTVEDIDFLFQIEVLKRDNATRIYQKDGAEWLSNEQLGEVEFDLERGDKITVYKRNKESDTPVSKVSWDTNSDWPAEARGASSTVVPYDF